MKCHWILADEVFTLNLYGSELVEMNRIEKQNGFFEKIYLNFVKTECKNSKPVEGVEG